jgi:hypothetical protein
VLEKITNSTNQSKYSVNGCALDSVYKYICENSSANVYPWYKRWKDTVEIKAYTVTRLRIRWAETSYNPSERTYPYFSHGEDELMEFPGMVYHCHILPHEENMMMRPIMLQPSDAYTALVANEASPNASKCTSNPVWSQNQECINNALGCLLYNATVDVESFNFHVHCPLRSRNDGGFIELMKHLNASDPTIIGEMETQLSTVDTYAVFERVFTVNPLNQSSEMLMSYCGWAKLLNESDCSNARFVCTIPGPMFRVAVGVETAVIWVNQIDGPNFDWSFAEDNCYDQSNNNSYCWQKAKQASDESCRL